MKLEVGKKYVDRSGDVWEIVHKVRTSYVGDCSVGNIVGFFDSEGYYVSDDDETCDLVKEYHEPRPVKEVMMDLAEIVKCFSVVCTDYGHSRLYQGKDILSYVKEAEEVMKGLEGEN